MRTSIQGLLCFPMKYADALKTMDYGWLQNIQVGDLAYVPSTARHVTLRALTIASGCWEDKEACSLKLAGWLGEQTFPSASDGILMGSLVKKNQKLFNSKK